MSRALAALTPRRFCSTTTTTTALRVARPALASTSVRLCSSSASSTPAPPTKPNQPRASSPAMRELLQSIFARNESWVHATETDEPELLAAMAKGQSPKILWLGCSDSRVPEGVVCQTKPGEIFVHRNIAGQFNQQDDSANSVLTYAVEVLGVEQIVCVGHTSCGGVAAALQTAKSSQALPSQALGRYLTPLIKLSGDVASSNEAKGKSETELLQLVTEANVRAQMDNIIASDVVQANWQGKKTAFPGEPTAKIEVHGWIHDISTGRLHDLGVSRACDGTHNHQHGAQKTQS